MAQFVRDDGLLAPKYSFWTYFSRQNANYQKKKMGDLGLTGSQMFQMMKRVSKSLAGRVGILPMQELHFLS